MARFLFIFFLFFPHNSFGQIDSTLLDSLNRLIYSPDYLASKYDSFTVKIDSIEANVKYNPNEIIADNFFIKSKRSLIVRYYFKNATLFYITTSELCPSKPGLTYHSRYYIVADKINQEEHSSSKKTSHAPQTFKEITEQHYCSSRFEYHILEKYVWALLQRIRVNTYIKS
jgi:hypothetical protein